MPQPEILLKRLEAIATSFSLKEGALALFALGSSGLEVDRLDAYSDLDFFAIVAQGFKERFIEEIEWLLRVHPIGFIFGNTRDGYKLMFEDGVFCEMAVFTVEELPAIPRPQGKIVWSIENFDPLLSKPAGTKPDIHTVEWLLGEALSNLYVGIGRFRRGEKMSAMRFVQGHALERLMDLIELVEVEMPIERDPFSQDRRLEQRFPNLAERLPRLAQGYERTPQSAVEILFFLEDHFPVNPLMAREIRRLLRGIVKTGNG